jgi:hypothetical protein
MNEEFQQPKGIVSEGADSYLRGLPREDCPYPPGSAEREERIEGWNQAGRPDGTVHV